MNILFLDVGGVLNSHMYLCNKYDEKGKKALEREEFIDPKCMYVLKEIVKKFDLYIVIISAWKIIDEEYALLKNIFLKYDLHILDRTKNYGSKRGREINEWINNNNVKKYVVLDNEIFEDYKQYNILDHLVKTNFYDDRALKYTHLNQIKKIMDETTI